jgi:hypothetical protein
MRTCMLVLVLGFLFGCSDNESTLPVDACERPDATHDVVSPTDVSAPDDVVSPTDVSAPDDVVSPTDVSAPDDVVLPTDVSAVDAEVDMSEEDTAPNDPCSLDNGGCGENAYCLVEDGAIVCPCKGGFVQDKTGTCVETPACLFVECATMNSHCEDGVCVCDAGYLSNEEGQCVDIDECDGSDCGAGGTCTHETGETAAGDYTCTCSEGYKGGGVITPCDDIDECATEPSVCEEGKECVNNLGGYGCVCLEGYAEGPDGACQDIDECNGEEAVCGPNTVCQNTEGAYTCLEVILPEEGNWDFIEPTVDWGSCGDLSLFTDNGAQLVDPTDTGLTLCAADDGQYVAQIWDLETLCDVSSDGFTCQPLPSHLLYPEQDIDLEVELTLSGTFETPTMLKFKHQIDLVNCDGGGCSLLGFLGVNTPCSMAVQGSAELAEAGTCE